MKQSTFFAVMANKLLTVLQGYTKGIRFVAVLTMLLTLGIGQAWGASTVQGGYIYFDATKSGWSVSDVQMVVGHNSYSAFYGMSNISNTTLYYLNVSGWSDATYFAFANGCSTWGAEGSNYDNRKSWISGKYTAAKTNYTLNNNNYYLFYASTSSNNASITTSSPAGHLGTSYSALNYTQTVQQHLSTDGGSNYSASTTALATVKVSSYKLDSKNTTTSSSGIIASGQSSATCSAARTATVTYTVSDVKAGYTFVGWYDGNTQKSTETTYDAYQATGEKTITARFTIATYTVKWVVDGQEKATETVAHGSKPTQAPTMDPNNPICGDKFVGWVTAPIEGQLKDAPANIYTKETLPAITGNVTFYAVFADYEN